MAQDIGKLLAELGLDRYAQVFAANDVDLDVLRDLDEGDLERLGLSLGHRKRLMRAVAELSAMPMPAPIAATEISDAGKPTAASAERRQLTILFCDLVGSTELSRHLDPEDMRDVLRSYQNAVQREVTRFNGHIAKFMGDGILAYFGWPAAYEDQAERAVRAAIAVVPAVRRLALPQAVELDVRVGIASGQVVVGDLLGEGMAQEAAVTGDAPNLAARLQEIATPGKIIICDTTRRLVGRAFALTDLGSRQLKGFTDATSVWRIVGEREFDSRFDVAQERVEAPSMVGRTHELGLLLDRWERVKASEGQVVLISGEAGIGKSRLVQAFRDKIAEDSQFRLRYQGVPYYTSSALYPIIARLERAARFRSEDSAEAKLDKLRRFLRIAEGTPDEHLPIFASMLSLPLSERMGLEELTPEQHKERTLMALLDQLLALARIRPVLFVYEDAHWMDPTTRELIERIITRIAAVPVLMLITHRPEWSQDWAARYDYATPMGLSRLSSSQIADMVTGVAAKPLDPELVKQIALRTDGVPLFIEELTRSFLETAEGTPNLRHDIPDTLLGLLQARLDRLDPDIREIAQIGAVIGREFRLDILARVVDRPQGLERAVAKLASSQLVLPSGSAAQSSYVFRHALIQEAAYSSLLLRRRREYHRRIAEAIEAYAPDVSEFSAELMAQHFAASDLPAKAIPYRRRAGQRALQRSANLEAIEHLKQGLEALSALPEGPERLAQQLEFSLDLGNAQLKAGQLLDAMQTYNKTARLARLAKSSIHLARAAIGFEEAEFLFNAPEENSVALLEEALAVMDTAESPERCRALAGLSRALTSIGSMQRSAETGQEASAMARRIHDPRALYDILFHNYLSSFHVDVLGAQGVLEEILAISGKLGDADLIARANALQLYNYVQLGDIENFERLRERTAALAHGSEVTTYSWNLTSAKVLLAILRGDFPGAEKLAEQNLSLGQAIQSGTAAGVYGIQMFTIRREQGRLAEVAPIFKRFMAENPQEATWRPGLALIASDLGFLEPARKTFDDIAAGGFSLPYDAKRSATLSYLAEVCARLEDADRARQLIERLLPYKQLTIAVGTAVVCYGSAARYLGLLATVMRDWDAATDHFENALVRNSVMQAWPWLAHTQADFAAMLKRRGGSADENRANDLLEAAWQAAERYGMVALRQQITALRSQVSAVR
jgi:class 3 adenylate cyclase/tetratricopeptide (TPR) repeat protein